MFTLKKTKLKRIFLTGLPGSGKTSLVLDFLNFYQGEKAGFITVEVREEGVRTAFLLKTFGGKEGIFASQKFNFPWKVGKYGVNLPLFEKLVLPELEKAFKNPHLMVVIDEIGKMELFSRSFEEALSKLLSLSNPLLATLGEFSHPLVSRIKEKEKVLKVRRENREEILQLLKETFLIF